MLTQIPLPESVRQAWGEPAARDFRAWMEEAMSEQGIPRSEWDEAQARSASFEARVDARFVQVETRLTILEHDVGELKTEMRELRREMNERFDRLNDRIDAVINQTNECFDRVTHQITVQTRWTVGTLALFCTLVAAMLAISQIKP